MRRILLLCLAAVTGAALAAERVVLFEEYTSVG